VAQQQRKRLPGRLGQRESTARVDQIPQQSQPLVPVGKGLFGQGRSWTSTRSAMPYCRTAWQGGDGEKIPAVVLPFFHCSQRQRTAKAASGPVLQA
jgi:hypothetical protein